MCLVSLDLELYKLILYTLVLRVELRQLHPEHLWLDILRLVLLR